ncbi:MAG: PorV/PorQ family protein [Ignavibacteria bacterium]|nr:PorV/PorQ family protein [Ignavibacteria bacterium]MBI3766241.1 PorV/PorQ family protein [Ignavibacteriales bacterium]
MSRATAQLIPNLGGQRVGISAFQFLKLGVGARGVGLGESFTAIANDVSALYWNPAGLTQFSENQLFFAHTEYVVEVKHEFFGAAYHLSPGDAIGFSVTSLHTEEMEITTETQPFGTGRYFRFGDIALGASYSRKMTDQFSFGLTLKYVEETLDVLKMRGVMADLGTYYWTGIGTSRFAIVISNFGADVAPTGEITLYSGVTDSSFQSFSPPTLFKIGFAMEPMENENQRVTTSFELNHPNDNAENIHLGIEYQWERWLRLRTGVKRTIGEPLFGRDNSSSNDITFGIGVSAPVSVMKVDVDYAYANFNLLGSVHRISLSLSY